MPHKVSFQLHGVRWTFVTPFIDLHLSHRSTKLFLKFEKWLFLGPQILKEFLYKIPWPLQKECQSEKSKKTFFHLKTCHTRYLSNYLGPDGPWWHPSSISISHIDLQKCFENLKSHFFLDLKSLRNSFTKFLHFYWRNIKMELFQMFSVFRSLSLLKGFLIWKTLLIETGKERVSLFS